MYAFLTSRIVSISKTLFQLIMFYVTFVKAIAFAIFILPSEPHTPNHFMKGGEDANGSGDDEEDGGGNRDEENML
ncbi:hypothetical protein F4777DRAFT_65248 [Nemania sp. FL0916]|nr:hypothetical protein F4777DRAFT_65248 [Nemania sp. FL0916]